ncbi:Cysteinyl-tRNA synthetase [Aphelenchoides besseyi]|nr:Cysteinyl-tRNA synthetase [Aphelenchoides besseyi]
MSEIIYDYLDRELSSWISKKSTHKKFFSMDVPELDTLSINERSSSPPKLKLYNSLTRSKDEFCPLNGNQVKAYICGPTVYASAHLGHARAYLSFDILRRVLSNYFNYDVLYVMNITDIDDKIIKRARQNFLFDQYAAKAIGEPLKQVFNDVIKALGLFDAKFRAETDADKQKMLTEMIQKVNNAVKNIETEFTLILKPSIENISTRNWYLKPIVIKTQLRNIYVKAKGELSFKQDRLSEKRSAADFALWKSSKAGEPEFESKWGKGRPGWHVECSVMSTEICGDKLDIHAGGFDLKFPHHDNEIAQCEAHFDNDDWVRYFLHCGTLRIEGSKMSKSLKNFISIKDALKEYTARQLRLLFLMHNWSDTLDYSSQTMQRALQFEKFSNEFFLNVKDLLRRQKSDKPSDSDIHAALCDSIDTRTVVEKLRELINAANIYIKEKNGAEVDRESILMPHLTALAEFRQEVRTMAREQKNTNILQECDRLRDDVLPSLGVRLEDSGAHTAVKLVDPEILLREQEQKRAIEEAKRVEKERKKREQEEKERLKRIPPHEFFKQPSYATQYTKYDENGIPTHNSDGKELSKSERKNCEKTWNKQKNIFIPPTNKTHFHLRSVCKLAFKSQEMSKFGQNSANDIDTCCRHGHGCDLATSDPTPQEKSDRSLIHNASYVYLKTGDAHTLDDERTFFENRSQAKNAYRLSSSNRKAKPQQTKSDTLIDRFYLGCRTKSEAARALSDRHSLGIYHQIPVTDDQLCRGLQQQKDISIDVEFALHIVQREGNGDLNHYRVHEKDNGAYGRVFYLDFGDELKGIESHSSLEELLHYHSSVLVKVVLLMFFFSQSCVG